MRTLSPGRRSRAGSLGSFFWVFPCRRWRRNFLGPTLCLLLRLLGLLLGLFFNAGKLAQNLSAIFRVARFSSELQFKKLLQNFVELRPSGNAKSFEFVGRQCSPHRPPFLEIIANLRHR